MTNTIKILHDTAMDFYDFARIAKAKGKEQEYRKNLEKAYIFEKEAALKMPEEEHNFMWRYIFLRSAGNLAFEYGAIREAKELAELGLADNPPAYEKSQLEELLTLTKQKLDKEAEKDTTGLLQFYGILASVDLDLGKIKIRTNPDDEYFIFMVPKEKAQSIARYYIGDLVKVEAKEDKDESIIVEYIGRAA